MLKIIEEGKDLKIAIEEVELILENIGRKFTAADKKNFAKIFDYYRERCETHFLEIANQSGWEASKRINEMAMVVTDLALYSGNELGTGHPYAGRILRHGVDDGMRPSKDFFKYAARFFACFFSSITYFYGSVNPVVKRLFEETDSIPEGWAAQMVRYALGGDSPIHGIPKCQVMLRDRVTEYLSREKSKISENQTKLLGIIIKGLN